MYYENILSLNYWLVTRLSGSFQSSYSSLQQANKNVINLTKARTMMRDDPNAKPYIGPASATCIIIIILG